MTPAPQHRMLAIDGGGVRGVVALEVLAELEQTLRTSTGKPDLRLGDWFDYVAGTSTGAIIATALALGRSVDDVKRLYVEHMGDIFKVAGWRSRLKYRYDHRALTRILKDEFGEHRTLATPDLRCLLMIGLRNASTDSPWPLSSNPSAMYNDVSLPDHNLQIPLWQLVRASTAAPTYFPSESITFGNGSVQRFTDGGTTPLNNPALQLVLMATCEEYRLQWPVGAERLLLVSIGTGAVPGGSPVREERTLLQHAREIPSSLMHSVGTQQDMMCRVLGRLRHGPELDSEIGSVAGIHPGEPWFTYLRYDAEITDAELKRRGLPFAADPMQRLDGVDQLPQLAAFGRSLATDVRPEHLAGF